MEKNTQTEKKWATKNIGHQNVELPPKNTQPKANILEEMQEFMDHCKKYLD
jgi:hypothetical protein